MIIDQHSIDIARDDYKQELFKITTKPYWHIIGLVIAHEQTCRCRVMHILVVTLLAE